jgi:signal transduction histidine kinase
MTLARKLRVALASYVALLALMLAFLVHGTGRTLDANRAESEIGTLLSRVNLPRVPTTASELEEQRVATRVMREASQIAVAAEFARAEQVAGSARITVWVLAAGAVLLGLGLWMLLARSEELEQLKRELVSNASHDLKSPLSSMQEVNAAMLDGVTGPLLESQRRLLLANQDSARRLASMVNKLLELARLESKPALDFMPVDMVDVARESAHRAQALLRLHQRVIVATDAEPIVVHGNREELDRMIDNLLENALKFSPPETTVRVAVSASSTHVHLTVADEGPGIAEAEKAFVFQRFYQTDAGRATRSRGLGLGLAICRDVIDAHGGTISVFDNAPRGSVFRVTIPIRSPGYGQRRIANFAGSKLIPTGPRTAMIRMHARPDTRVPEPGATSETKQT